MVGINSSLGELFNASPALFIAVVAVIIVGVYFYLKRRPQSEAPPAITVDHPLAAPVHTARASDRTAADTAAEGTFNTNVPDDITVAALIAIIAEESGIPADKLNISTMKETGRAAAGAPNNKYTIETGEEPPDMKYRVTLNDVAYEVVVEGGAAAAAVATAVTPGPADAEGGLTMDAPLAGVILEVNVRAGESVKSGHVLCVLEALKMENEILAPHDAVVSRVYIQKGDTVSSGNPMFTLL